MAIKELINVFPFNYPVAKATTFYAGMVLARGTDGNVVVANRATVAHQSAGAIVGLAADDKASTGVTFIQSDPVGSSYVDSSGVLQAANNGWFVGAKRGLADNAAFDETVTGVTDLTSGSTGYQGPRRGVGVYNTPGGQFVTDQFSLVTTYGVNADSGGTWTPAPGDACTFAYDGTGKLVDKQSLSFDGGVGALNISALPGGLYTLRLTSNSGVTSAFRLTIIK
jgi:hypothetical protein